jgi:mannose-1-phosphate guanylyltransferase
MKAFILAAGLGTRLRPLTDNIPKCLLPISDRPLLGIWLDQCRRFGVTKVLVNVHNHRAPVERFLASEPSDLEVTLAEEPVLLGSAGTLAANREWLGNDQHFWILYGDVLTNADMARMRDFHFAHPSAATLGIVETREPSRCGIATLAQDGRITHFVEKPANPSGNLAFSGLMIATLGVFASIPENRPADIGFHVLPRLAGNMYGYRITEYLQDIGTPQNYLAAQAAWKGSSLAEAK